MKPSKLIKLTPKAGLTIAEMLIVVVLIGILGTISLSYYWASQKYARFYNVVAKVAESIRIARNLAINSQLISNQTPAYYQVELSIDGGNKIKADLKGEAEDGIVEDLTKYDYISPEGYTFTAVPNGSISPILPISIKFTPPFGDTEIIDSAAPNPNSFVTMDFKIKPTDTSLFCMKISINKVSGLLSVDKATGC